MRCHLLPLLGQSRVKDPLLCSLARSDFPFLLNRHKPHTPAPMSDCARLPMPPCQVLAGLAVVSDAARQQMVDSRIVPQLVAALTDSDAGACVCVYVAVAVLCCVRACCCLCMCVLDPTTHNPHPSCCSYLPGVTHKRAHGWCCQHGCPAACACVYTNTPLLTPPPRFLSCCRVLAAGVRLGAVNTLRGLSRSVRVLRGTCLTPNLAGPLVSLLQDSCSTEVQVRF